MGSYRDEICPYVYNVDAVSYVVDGETLDCIFNLGFDVMFKSRVKLLGIDTPDIKENVYGKLSRDALKSWVYWSINDENYNIKLEIRCPEKDSRAKFGKILGELWVHSGIDDEQNGWTNVNKWLCEHGYAIGYWNQTKNEVEEEHLKNKKILAETGIQKLINT